MRRVFEREIERIWRTFCHPLIFSLNERFLRDTIDGRTSHSYGMCRCEKETAMPVDFLSPEQEKRYGRYTAEPDPDQLARYFHLDDADRTLVAKKRGDHNRLGFALQLCTVRFLGTFLSDPTEIPPGAIVYVARQIGVKHPVCVVRYKERPATHREHAGEIQRIYGYCDFYQPASLLPFLRWLYVRAWVSAERPSVLFDLATARLSEHKILLPGVSVLARLVARTRDRATLRLWKMLAQVPETQQREDPTARTAGGAAGCSRRSTADPLRPLTTRTYSC